MNQKLAVALLALGCVTSVATSAPNETPVSVAEPVLAGDSDGCDDPFPAICVTTLDAQGADLILDAIEIQDADQVLVEDIACGNATCCSYDLASGSYVVVVEHEGEILAEPVAVDNSHACDHDPVELTLQFGEEG